MEKVVLYTEKILIKYKKNIFFNENISPFFIAIPMKNIFTFTERNVRKQV